MSVVTHAVLASAAAVAALHAPPSPSLLRALAQQYSAEGRTAAAAALLTKVRARVWCWGLPGLTDSVVS